MKGYYALVAGKVDQFESPATALIREASEEAGIIIKPTNLTFVSVFHRQNAFYKDRQNDIVEFIFIADKWGGDITNMEPHLCDEIGFYDIKNLPDTVTETTKTALKCWENKQPYFEFKI